MDPVYRGRVNSLLRLIDAYGFEIAAELMASLIFLPIADEIESGTYLLYDGA